MAGAVNPKAVGSKPVCGAKHRHYDGLSLLVNWLFAATPQIAAIFANFPILHHPQESPWSRSWFDRDQSLASRAAVEAFIKKTGAQLWTEHDLANFNKQKTAPGYYE